MTQPQLFDLATLPKLDKTQTIKEHHITRLTKYFKGDRVNDYSDDTPHALSYAEFSRNPYMLLKKTPPNTPKVLSFNVCDAIAHVFQIPFETRLLYNVDVKKHVTRSHGQ
jgi:hypothetical protein